MSEDGKFSFHIKNVVKNAYFKLSLIFKVFQSRKVDLLKKAYVSYVRRSLEYCSIIWSPYYLQDINLIEKVQKYFTRKLLGKKHSYVERLSLLNLESLEERRVKIDLIETYKFFSSSQDRNFADYFKLNPNPYQTAHDLFINFSRTDARKYWFANRVCPWWNQLPLSVKQSKSVHEFKRVINKVN